MTVWANVLRNAAQPARAAVMAHKVYGRARYGVGRERAEAMTWAAAHTRDLREWADAQSPPLWRESVAWAAGVRTVVQPVQEQLLQNGVDMGGPGCIELLYFLTRLTHPETVVETGVAAGWSTRAILAAIDVNRAGSLYSSDFPYFRLKDPERYIGYAVPPELRQPWTLLLNGDRANLTTILAHRPTIGLVHYDSDKSRGGRQSFVRRVVPYFKPDALFVMDDIGNDLFFRDYSAGRDRAVFAYEGKHLGLINGGWDRSRCEPT